jgi:4-hydroxythreonine-4-phosphate dehydrogenase
MNSSVPRVAVLPGDPAGVGPEMTVRLLQGAANRAKAELVLIADPLVLQAGERIVGQGPVEVTAVDRLPASDEATQGGRLLFLAQDALGGVSPSMGVCTAEAGRSVLASLDAALDAVAAGLCDGIVFAPFNKHSLRLGGMTEEDELRYMQRRLAVDGFVCEFNITGKLWTSRVTSHVPVRQVADLVTEGAVCDAVRIIDAALRSAGVAKPRIAVSGLNPHAGDGGSIGTEEIEVIGPAVRMMQAEGVAASGPWSPDTVFVAARRGDFDAVVSMYHDQGQIAMKLLGFEQGVTLHGGLPVPVATSASGSAFDIAGKGVARVEGLEQALGICCRMAGAVRADRLTRRRI